MTGIEIVFDTQAPLNQERKFNHEECGDKRQRPYVKRTTKGLTFLSEKDIEELPKPAVEKVRRA